MDLHITSPNELGKKLHSEEYTADDGLGLWKEKHYIVENSIIDMSGSDDVGEALTITYGASANFNNCLIRGAAKLILCGSGKEQISDKEYGKEVIFTNCVFENFGRCGPEVQSGMKVILENCLIRNWGDPDFFSVRNFGAWAHNGGEIIATNCVFWQDHFSFSNFFEDIGSHIGQAFKDRGFFSIFNPFNYRLGICRGLIGDVEAKNCYKNRWWIKLENCDRTMPRDEALALISKLEYSISSLYK